MNDNQTLHVGSVFQVSMRNVNIKGRSNKGGMIYRFEAEITEDDFDLFRGHDLTGSCFEAMVECTAMPDSPGSPDGRTSTVEVENVGPSPAPETKPWGREASELYRVGFFFNPIVIAHVGTDQDYLVFLKTQPCCARGSMIADKAHAGDIVPAHVRRIAAGAGTGIKPEFSAVPMCDRHHKLQHQHGESAVGGKDFFDRERARHLSRWMAQTVFSKESMGHVDPQNMRSWCFMSDIQQYLPESY